MALDAAVSHEDSPVLTIRRLLTPSGVAQVHAAAAELRQKQKPHAYDNVLINAASDDRPFGLAPSHESLFLHEGGFFARACPEVCRKVLSAVRSRHADGEQFGTRCIEFHTYRIGGALLDPEHRDMGSTLTLSCLSLTRAPLRAAPSSRGRAAAPSATTISPSEMPSSFIRNACTT